MSLYRFEQSYRGVNRTKNETDSKYPKFHNFKKGEVFEGEEYVSKSVNGVTIASQPLIVISNDFLIPAKALHLLEGDELNEFTENIDEKEKSANEIDMNKVDSDKADILEGKNIKNVLKNNVNVGKGAVVGGILGFGAAYFLKKNKWIGILIGVAVGSTFVVVQNHMKKNKEAKLKEESKTE